MSEATNVTTREKLLLLGVFAAVVVTAAGFRLLRGNSPEPASPRPDVAPAAPPGTYRGISLQLRSGHPDHPWNTYIDEIAATGANTVCLVVAAFQENCASTSIFLDMRKTPSDERLKELIRYAHDRGLQVVLMPLILLENPRQNEWRGKISPATSAEWDAWWEDYVAYILHYAWIAEETGVEVFMIGSELISTESQTQRWRDLIARLRGAYRGLLSYSANWDHYRPVEFWDELDLIGMTTYYDLTGGKEPTLDVLMASWEPIRRDVLDWQRTRHPDKPILFTEVGWPNLDTCAQYPWDYTLQSAEPDPRAQANCFQAFFETWADRPEVAGFLIWEWQNYPQLNTDPAVDRTYVPKDKPAMTVIRRYLQQPESTETAQATEEPEGQTQ